jgi:hypothetical protein
MINKKFWLGILVIVLVFGILVLGCDENGKYDSSLNGTWVDDYDDIIITFKDGNFEISDEDGPLVKGTYTTKDDKITMTVTQTYNPDESKWYTKTQLSDALKANNVPENTIKEILDEIFTSIKGTYKINGSTLTITDDDDGDVWTLKKK